MNTKHFLIPGALLLFFANLAGATTRTAATCNSTDVQNAINASAAGDTVIIPAGTCTWTAGVTVSGKAITILGGGSGRIVAYSSSTLAIGTGAKTLNISTAQVGATIGITNGQTVRISETGNRQNFMVGTVTGISGGVLNVNVTSSGGSCGSSAASYSPSNCGRWLVSTTATTVLVNNSGTAMFNVTEDSTGHIQLGGFKIQAGTGTGNGVNFQKGGGQAILLHDCWIEQGKGDSIWVGTNRGVIWSCSFDATPFSMAPLAVHLQPYDESAWNMASFMGMKDTTGQNNFYVENSDFHAYLNSTDNDEGARSVWRYNLFNNAGFGTHGVDTGLIGQRYFEYYNNVGVFNGYANGTTFNMTWWFFVRGGTFVIHDNTIPALNSTDYPGKLDVNMTEMALQRNAGPIPCWGAGTPGGAKYPGPRQVGFGYVTGSGKSGLGVATYSLASFGYPTPEYVGDSEPAYMWGNSRQPLNAGTSDYGTTQSDSCGGVTDSSANYIVANRDYVNGSTAKPGYTPYTYPHPLRQGGTTTGPTVTAPNSLLTNVQ